ncbi:hypothetical protein [Streptomyces clavifer]|uniref:hypothetical protein n=1 Tax=Streptomyces clavifer TaxID=68188 RepID=UPI003659B9F4
MRSATVRTLMHCPACRTTRMVHKVGTCTVNTRRHLLVQCADKACELTWATRGRAA